MAEWQRCGLGLWHGEGMAGGGAVLGLGAGSGCQVLGCLVDGGRAEQCCRVVDGVVLDDLREGAWFGAVGEVRIPCRFLRAPSLWSVPLCQSALG